VLGALGSNRLGHRLFTPVGRAGCCVALRREKGGTRAGSARRAVFDGGDFVAACSARLDRTVSGTAFSRRWVGLVVASRRGVKKAAPETVRRAERAG